MEDPALLAVATKWSGERTISPGSENKSPDYYTGRTVLLGEWSSFEKEGASGCP